MISLGEMVLIYESGKELLMKTEGCLAYGIHSFTLVSSSFKTHKVVIVLRFRVLRTHHRFYLTMQVPDLREI